MENLDRDQMITGAFIAGLGQRDGLDVDEVVDGLLEAKAKKETAYREAMIRRQRNADAAGVTADELLADAANFETKGRFEEQERYPDPFGIPVSPVDPPPSESISKEADQRRERGQYVIVDRGRGKERVWRERPGLKPGTVNPNEPAVREQLFSEPKYVGGRPKDDIADPFAKHTVAPAGIGMGGPNGLATQLADMVVRGELDPNTPLPHQATGRSATGQVIMPDKPRTVGDLLNELAMAADPQLAVEADREIGRQTAQRDAARFSPTVRAINDAKAERRAIANIANVDNGLSSIQDIQSLGIASKKFNRGSNMSVFSVVPNADGDITDRDGGIDQMVQYLMEGDDSIDGGRVPAGVVLPGTDTGYRTAVGASNLANAARVVQHLVQPGFAGPEGPTIGYVDRNDRFIGDVDINSQGSYTPTKTQAWLEANLPDLGRAGGTSFGYPQVNIGDTLSLLNQRLGDNAPEGGVRSIEDLENTFVRMIDSKLDKGGVLTNYDPEQGKAVRIADPGIDEVLYALNYTKNEKAQLANALMQQQAAMVSPVNQGFKYLYEQGLYDPRGQFVANNYDGSVRLGRVAGEKVGIGDKKGDRVSVRKGLKNLDGVTEVTKDRDPASMYATTPDGAQVLLPDFQQDLIDAKEGLTDAQQPFQGAPAGSKPPKQSFIRGNARGMSQSALAARMGTERAARAQGVEQRYLEDERRRRTPEVTSPERQAIKDKDAQIGAEGARRRKQDIENKAKGVKPFRGTPQQFDESVIKDAIASSDSGKPKHIQELERRIEANAKAAEAKRLLVAGGVDTRAVGIASPQRATSAVTSPTPDPTPLQLRGGWVGKQLPPGQRGGELAIREASAIRRQPTGKLASRQTAAIRKQPKSQLVNNRIERVNVQVDAPVERPQSTAPTQQTQSQSSMDSIRTERTKRTAKAPPRGNNRNQRIRDILGYGSLAAGAGVGIGAGINSTYNSKEQEPREREYV